MTATGSIRAGERVSSLGAILLRRMRRLPSSWPLILIFGGAALVLVLWWQSTPAVAGLDGWLTNAGRITGLLAGYGCAVLLALMSRIPALEHGVGTDRLARWHALGGRYTISLIIVHALLIIWGYAITAGTGVIEQAGTILFDYPDMLKATVGFLLLLVVGITSARVARSRLRYEIWHFVHFSTYIAVFLVFFHQLATGAQFVDSAWARAVWYALYISVALALVWFRFVVPIRRGLRHDLRVTGVRTEAPEVVSVYMSGQHLEDMGAKPGQFFRWRFLAPGLRWSANPYSLSAPVGEDHLRITVKDAGGHSRALAALRPGTRVWAEGPYGAFTGARPHHDKSLLLAGGVGITPLRALFETLPGDVILVYLARRPENLALRGELDAIAADRGTRAHYFVDEPAAHSLSLTAEKLRALVPDLLQRDVYLCGPPGMTAAAKHALKAAGVRRRDIRHETFEF
ncbi:ferredoxin reductase family protein [Actinomadura xylanilytica]|uniref:ferredoxin reductase family protein n=1 Tax=Actinomadura xylanilytica TaxID=887459 RepID=UPI00255ABAF2|nr:ferric reductase-like transmembrane domain-containing protein [Actinomadura xylanilytica]MDL4773527.1 ferric reductase-like transmembrane domain-containing protein [Actinomadura xylanilytica]